MGYPYTVDEHDIPPGVTVCCIKDARTGQIVRDGLHIDQAEALAEGMNEDYAICGTDDDGDCECRQCPYCDGTGGDPLDDFATTCSHCLGEGVLWD